MWEDHAIFRRVTTDVPVWTMSSSILGFKAHGSLYIGENAHTYGTHTLTVHAYADSYKQAHTQAVTGPSGHTEMDV